MEQLNKIVKTMWRSLGANLNESLAARVANAINEMEEVLDGIDKDCEIDQNVGYRSKGKPENAVAQITNDLVKIQAFKTFKGRKGHPTFANFLQTLLGKLNYKDLHTWMTDLIKTWDAVYSKENSNT